MSATKSIVEVGVAMVLKDRFSQEAGQISSSFNGMMRNMNTWGQAMRSSFGGIMDTSQKMLSGFGQAYSHMAEVHNQIFLASKMSGATLTQEKELLQLAKDVNAITPLTNQDIASGMRYMAMAGNSVEQIKNMTEPASKLASIFNMPLGEKGGVADLMTNIMAMFVIPSEKATQVVDDLYTAVTSANISLTDLAQSITYAGADMANAGYDLRQTAAAIGVLGDMGIQGSSAGTALANMIRYLQLSLAQQKQKGYSALQSLGLSPEDFLDAQGNLIRLDKVYQKFAQALSNQPLLNRTQAFYNIFGVRGSRDINNQIRNMMEGSNKMATILNRYDQNQGAVNETMAQYLNTPKGLISQLKSHIDNFITTTGEQLKPLLDPLISGITSIIHFVQQLQQTWVGGFATRVIATGAAVAFISTGFKIVRNTLRMITSDQTTATALTQGMSRAAALANQQFLIMETHMVRMVNYMRQLVQLQMYAQGLSFNKAGRLIDRKTGRFVKGLPNVGPTEMLLGPTLLAGSMGGNAAAPATTPAAPTTGPVPPAARGFRGVLNKLVKPISRLAGVIPGWGTAIAIGLPLLIDGFNWLTDAVNENTDAQRKKEEEKDPLAIKAQNEKNFLDAVKLAIREGMKDSTIQITIDGQPVGQYQPGTKADYTGRALGIE